MITAWPKWLQSVAVSTTIRPVTQTAEVEVKIAVRKEAFPGPGVANGSDKSPAPTKIAAAKATTTSCVGCRSSGRRGLMTRAIMYRDGG